MVLEKNKYPLPVIALVKSKSKLFFEMENQLQTYPLIELNILSEKSPLLLKSSAVAIFLLGFSSKKYEIEILYKNFLNLSRSQTKTIVLINKTSDLTNDEIKKIRIKLKEFGVNCELLEINISDPLPETVEMILSKVIYRYKKPSSIDRVSTIKNVKKQNIIKSNPKPLAIILVSIVGLINLILFQVLIAVSLSGAYISTFINNPGSASPYLKTVASGISSLLVIQGKILPPLEKTLSELGLVPDENTRLLNSVSDVNSGYKHIYSFIEKESQISLSNLNSLLFESSQLVGQLKILEKNAQEYYLNTKKPPGYLSSLGYFLTYQREILEKIDYLSPFLSEIFGFEKTSTVMVLLQDESTSLPLGGEIIGLALLTLEKGQISQSLYLNPAEMILLKNGEVEIPDYLKNSVPATYWSRVSSNWDSDLVSNSSLISRLYSQVFYSKPEYVISMTGYSVQQLAPQILSSDENTVFQNKLAESKIPEEKKQIIFNHYKNLVGKLFSDSFKSKTISTIFNLLEKRQMSFAALKKDSFSNSILGWNGGEQRQVCASNLVCVDDYIYLAGISATNANPNQRDMSYQINIEKTIKDKEIMTQVYLQPENLPVSRFRLFVPEKQYLHSYKIGDLLIHGPFLPVTVNAKTNEYYFSLSGAILPADKLILNLSQKSSYGSEKFHYSFSVLNQPGVINGSVNISFSYPDSWLATSYSQAIFASQGNLRYNASTISPLLVRLDLQKK